MLCATVPSLKGWRSYSGLGKESRNPGFSKLPGILMPCPRTGDGREFRTIRDHLV